MATETSMEVSFWEQLGDGLNAFSEWVARLLTRLLGSSNERYIRNLGYIPPPPGLDRLRDLAKEFRALRDEDVTALAAASAPPPPPVARTVAALRNDVQRLSPKELRQLRKVLQKAQRAPRPEGHAGSPDKLGPVLGNLEDLVVQLGGPNDPDRAAGDSLPPRLQDLAKQIRDLQNDE